MAKLKETLEDPGNFSTSQSSSLMKKEDINRDNNGKVLCNQCNNPIHLGDTYCQTCGSKL